MDKLETKEKDRLRKIDLTTSQLQLTLSQLESSLSQMQQTESKVDLTTSQLQSTLSQALDRASDALAAATCNARDFYPQGEAAWQQARDERAEMFRKLAEVQAYAEAWMARASDHI